MFLTVSEVASRMRVSERTVRRWVSTGQLPAFRTGSVTRIDDTALDAFIIGGCRTAEKTPTIGGSASSIKRPENRLGALLGLTSKRQKRLSNN